MSLNKIGQISPVAAIAILAVYVSLISITFSFAYIGVGIDMLYFRMLSLDEHIIMGLPYTIVFFIAFSIVAISAVYLKVFDRMACNMKAALWRKGYLSTSRYLGESIYLLLILLIISMPVSMTLVFLFNGIAILITLLILMGLLWVMLFRRSSEYISLKHIICLGVFGIVLFFAIGIFESKRHIKANSSLETCLKNNFHKIHFDNAKTVTGIIAMNHTDGLLYLDIDNKRFVYVKSGITAVESIVAEPYCHAIFEGVS